MDSVELLCLPMNISTSRETRLVATYKHKYSIVRDKIVTARLLPFFLTTIANEA